MLNNPVINKFIATVAVMSASVVILWQIWNWVMPTIGIGELSFIKFLGLWVLVKGLNGDFVKINWPTKANQPEGEYNE